MTVHQGALDHSAADILSQKEMHRLFQGRNTRSATPSPEREYAFRSHFGDNLSIILPLLQDEVRYALEEELPWPETWQSVPIQHKLQRIVALLTGRVLFGAPQSRDQEWLKVSVNFTADLERVKQASQKMNRVIRPMVVPFLPEVAQAAQNLKRAEKCLEPVVTGAIARRKRNSAGEKEGLIDTGEKGVFLPFLLSQLPDNDTGDTEQFAIHELLVSFTSITNTARLLSQVILDLASRPTYIGPLRDEIEQAIAQDGMALGSGGVKYIHQVGLTKLKKLHSFIRESRRCGKQHLVPMKCQRSENAAPEDFDGFRYARLDVPAGDGWEQSLDKCEILVIVIELLLDYDFRIKSVVEKGGEGRPVKRRKNTDSLANGSDNATIIEVRRRMM